MGMSIHIYCGLSLLWMVLLNLAIKQNVKTLWNLCQANQLKNEFVDGRNCPSTWPSLRSTQEEDSGFLLGEN